MSVAYRNPWTPEEDSAVSHLVNELGTGDWSLLAKRLVSEFFITRRSGKQCRERWYNHLSPTVSKNPWTEEEDALIVHLYKTIGKRWTIIASRLPGRTDNSVKNRFYSSLRKKLRKFNKKKPFMQKVVESSRTLLDNPNVPLIDIEENWTSPPEICSNIRDYQEGPVRVNAFLASGRNSGKSKRNETGHESSLLNYEENLRLLSLCSMTFNYFYFFRELETYQKLLESKIFHEAPIIKNSGFHECNKGVNS